MFLRMRTATWISIGLLVTAQAPAAEAVSPVAPQFVALSVPDAAKSAAWYREAFGLRVIGELHPPDAGVHIFILRSDSLLLEILQTRDARSPGAEAIKDAHLTHGIFKVGFHVVDLEKAVASLEKLGAKFETRIIDDRTHNLRFALLRDPDGNYVQLFGTPKPTTGP